MYTVYHPVLASIEEHDEEEIPIQKSCGVHWTTVVVAVLSLLNVAILAASMHFHRLSSASEHLPAAVARVQELPTEFVEFSWHTPWGSNNDSEADLLWNNINTAHGHIAVGLQWAKDHNV